MRHLIRLVTIRYLRAAPVRTFLTLFGIMLGVAAMVAIDAVNASVLSSFRTTIDTIAGKTALTVGEGTGIAEEFLEVVRGVEGVKTAVPLIEEAVRDNKSGTQLAVMAVDTLTDSQVRDYDVTASDVKVEDDLAFLNDPYGVLVTHAFAKRAGVKVGDVLNLSTVSGPADFTIRGTLAPTGPAKMFGGDLLLMDVYAAQIAFGRDKRFDRIDVIATPGTDIDVLAGRIEKAIKNKASVARPQRRSQETERVISGFNLGLSLASLVAIFVGGFIVYNALAIAVAQRRREIGILRALGATRRQILAVFIGEGLVLGAIGAVAGLGLGLLLARLVLKTASSVVSSMYVPIHAENLTLPPRQLIVSAAIGVAVAFVAAFFPARRAAFIEPASAMEKKVEAADVTLSSPSTSIKVGVATLVLAGLVAWLAHIREDYLLGYAVSGILAFALAFFAPAIARGVGLLARRVAPRFGPAVVLGTSSFTRNSGRNAVAIAALSMAMANVVNTDAFIDSMKYSMMRWLDRLARADLLIFSGRHAQAVKVDHPLPESLVEEIRKVPGVEYIDGVRSVRQSYRNQPYFLMSFDLVKYQPYSKIPVIAGDLDKALRAIEAGTAVAASDVFAHSFNVGVGDKVTLQTPEGPRSFEIAMVYADFSMEVGLLLTSRSIYRSVWRDRLINYAVVFLRPGTPLEQVREQIVQRWGPRYGLLVLSNGQFRAEYVRLIESSFGMLRAMQLVAIIVAVLGIVNTLLVTVIDRRMEIGTLKAIGANRKQVQQMFGAESALIGFAATLVGIVGGAVFSAYIVKELLRFQIGWQMSWQLSGWSILQTFVLAHLVSFLAALWPMRTAGRVDAVEALRYE
jgi:putative ABC transport system permease protein